jgi:hypothetical protein
MRHYVALLSSTTGEKRVELFARYRRLVERTSGLPAGWSLNLHLPQARDRVECYMVGDVVDRCHLVVGLAIRHERMMVEERQAAARGEDEVREPAADQRVYSSYREKLRAEAGPVGKLAREFLPEAADPP